MRTRTLRLIVAVWLIASPLNVTLDTAQATESIQQPATIPIEWRSPIEYRPPLRPLSAGTPQTITLEIVPATLIANSGATAMITATVQDITGDLMSGVNLGGFFTPSTLGTLSGLGTTNDSGTVTGLWTAGTEVGPGTFEVGDGVISKTAAITLTPDVSLASITVAPNPANLPAGAPQAFTAAGFDQYNNPVLITPTWTTNGGSINASTGAFTAQTTPATGRLVTATYGAISGTAVVNISAAPLASITVAPNPANLPAGAPQAFTAAGFDQYNNPVLITPTWTTNGGSINASTGAFTAQTTPATGRLVTATYGAISGTAVVNISAAPLASITVAPNPANLPAGAAQAFTAAGFDQYNNPVLITPTWTTNGGTINASTGAFTAQTTPATGRLVTATYGAISGTAVVNISAAPLASITVAPNPANLPAGAPQAFTAAGFDQYNNPVLITPTWTTNGGTINPSTGAFTAQTTPATGRLVTATYSAISGTAVVNISAAPLASITVAPNPANLPAGAPQAFTAAGFDQYNNPVLITPTWTTNGGSINASTGAFTAQTTPATGRLVTATYGAISGTAVVNISAAPLASITVAPNPANLPAGAPQAFTAAGFDQYNNPVLITPTWTTNGGTINASTGAFTAQTTPATGRLVTATYGAISGTAVVNISAAPLASITVAPNPANLPAGAAQAFTAAGFDQYNNPVLITPTWTTNGGSINASTGAFTAQTPPATGRLVTATYGAISGTAVVNISAAPLASITVSPSAVTMTVAATRTFTAAGFDQYNNPVLITPTWTTNGGTINASTGAFTAQTTPATGRLVTATYGAISGTAVVNISTAPLASITVAPNPANLPAGAAQAFTAAGFDQYNNPVLITPTWTTNAGSINASTGAFTAQTPPATGRLVTATYSTISGTAVVNVSAAPLASITVSPSAVTMTVAATRTFTAAGFDQYNNPVLITPTWTTNGGTINASTGAFTAQTTPATGRLVTATYGAISGTAVVNISAAPLASITVAPNPANLPAGAPQAFTAAGFDQYNNPVLITPTWTTNGGSINASTGAFTAQTTPATGRLVTATYGAISGTAVVNISAAPLASITVAPNPANLPAGAPQAFTAAGFDQYNNPVLITPTWTTNGGTINPSTGAFTAQTTPATGRLVTATYSAISGTAVVNISAAPLASITVAPNPANLPAGAPQAFTAAGFDQYNNPVLITPTWTTNGGTINASTGAFTAQTTPATGRLVTATYGAISGTAVVNISAAPLASITVSPSAVTMTVAATRTFTAAGFDQYNNPVLITPTWTTNGGSINASTGAFTAQITATAGRLVTATYSAISGTAVVNLVPDVPYTLAVQPPTAVISAGQRITYTAIATDTFGNPIGNVTGSTTFSIAPASGGVFAANAVTPTIKSTWIVTGVNGSVVSTATLTVTVAAFNRLAIENAPAGTGSAIDALTLNIYNTVTAYASAYDAYNNLIGARSVAWSGTGVVAGNLTPTTGISTTFTPVVSGTGAITATSSGITATTGIITVQAPFLRVSKTASPDPLTPGSPLQYTILYTNTGNAPAQNVIITETYPNNTTFLNSVPAPTAGTNVWSIGTLAVNTPQSIVVFMTTTNQMPVGTVLTNSVRMSAAKVDTGVYTTTTQVNALPDLSASVIDSPDPARPGDLLTYTLQYRNTGTAPVTSVRITETYPAEVSFVSADPPPNIYPNVWLTDTLNAVGDNSRTIVVRVRVNSPLADTTLLTNRMVVSAREAPPYTTTQQTLIVAPRLQLTKSIDPITPTANGLLTYTLRYTNTGSSYAANPIVTDSLPTNTSFVRCEPIGCVMNGSVVTWNPGQLGQQTSRAVTLTVHIANNLPDGSVITNTARITSTEQISAVAQLTTTIASAPEVSLSTSDGLTAIAAGQLTTYTLNLVNTGTAPAAGVVVTDRIPDYTTFVACSSCVAANNGVYSFTLGTLNANQSSAVTLSVRLAPTLPAGLRVITNTAAITTTTGGDALENDSALDVNTISTRPVLDLGVIYDSSTPYPGKIITYTLRYTNTSAMDTIGVVLTTTRALWLGSTPPGWTQDGATDLYAIGNLAAGQSGSISYVMPLPETYLQDTKAYIQTFFMHDGGPGGLLAAQADSTTFIGVPDLVIDQVIVPPAISPNRPFTVTVVIRNAGLGRACNPSNCGGFYLDTFIDPTVPPPSYPFVNYGFPTIPVTTTLAAGQVLAVNVTNISFTPTQNRILYFKVDNYGCPGTSCLPVGSRGGLVPEYDEQNNVSGPITLNSYIVRLPLIARNGH